MIGPGKRKDAVERIANFPPAARTIESAVRRKSISDSLQNPTTLVPIGICAVSAAYLILLSPIYGVGVVAGVILGISAATAVVSFTARYPREYLKNSRELADRLRQQRADLEEAELRQRRENLRDGFAEVGSTEGARALEDLFGEYEQLSNSLEEQRNTDPLSVATIPSLAEETFRRGLSVLEDALDLMRMVHDGDKQILAREIAEAEKEIEVLQADQSQIDRLDLKKSVLATLQDRQSSLSKLRLWVDQLLHHVQRCQSSLHATRVELAAIRTGGTKSSVDSVVAALQTRIDQIKEIQEELTRMGY